MFLSSLPFVYSKRAAAAGSPVSRYKRLRLNVLSVFLSGPAGSNYPALPYFDQTVPYHLWRSLGAPPSVAPPVILGFSLARNISCDLTFSDLTGCRSTTHQINRAAPAPLLPL